MAAKRMTTDIFISKATKVHGEVYDYSDTVYTLNRNKVSITCRIHGAFSQLPGNHLKGSGCNKCAVARCTSTVDDFVSKAKEIHHGKYSYELVEYTKRHANVNITCPEHGRFMQKANDHLFGAGCPACGNIAKALTATGVKRSSPHYTVDAATRGDYNFSGVLYCLRFESAGEIFYKIGVTKTLLPKRISALPNNHYEISVVYAETVVMNAAVIAEARILSKVQSYTPKLKFGGYTECFVLSRKECEDPFTS